MKTVLILLLLLFLVISTFCQSHAPINSGEILRQAIELHDSGDYKKAIALFNQIDRNDTNYTRCLYEKSLSYASDSQTNMAMKFCIEGLASKDQREYEPDLYNQYGNLLNEAGQSEKSLKIFDEGILKYPAYSMLYFNKGITLTTMNRYAEAEEVFKKTIIINPFQYSAHYFLGLCALNQGKIIPAMLSFTGYLLVNPEGKYGSKCINFLDAISRSKDEILEYKSKRSAGQDENFTSAEEILLSKIALEKEYKFLATIDDPILRQIQAIFEQQEYIANDPDFWMQYYIPYYKMIFKEGLYEPFINWLFQNTNVKAINDYNKKNEKTIKKMIAGAADYFNLIRATRELQYTKREGQTIRYLYINGELQGLGKLSQDGKSYIGPWIFYFNKGNTRSTGQFNSAGNREGEWTFYYFSGKLKAKEKYLNGKVQEEVTNYSEYGNISSVEAYSNDLENGISTNYYRTGQRYSVSNYVLGKIEGEKNVYNTNGSTYSVSHYVNSKLSGTTSTYFNNGQLKESSNYKADLLDGPYKSYFENGILSTEGLFVKDNAEGEWKYYHNNGKLKIRCSYISNKRDGLYEEYYDNGQLYTSLIYKKGLVNGESVYYDKDGKIYARISFENDIEKIARYFDKTGKQIGISEINKNGLDLTTYRPDGSKMQHRFYDIKGNIQGTDTTYFPSGKISETNQYRNGQLNGLSIIYYNNGNKKSVTQMVDGKEDGPYTGYFSHGQVQAEGWFSDNQAEGLWVYHDELGNLSSKIYYMNGEISGFKEEYLPNGIKIMEQKYTRGWLDELKQYDSTGKLLVIDSFVRGNGKYLLLYANGNKMEECNFVNGDFDGRYTKYYFDGSVESIQYFKNGLADSIFLSFHYKGAKNSEGQFLKGKKSGVWNIYHEDGSLNYTVNYTLDQLNGNRVFYTSHNQKDIEQTFKDNQKNGNSTKFDPNGSIAYAIHFEDDNAIAYTYLGSDGKLVPEIAFIHGGAQLKAYYPNGKLSRVCKFVDGKINGTDILYYADGHVRSIDSSDYNINEGPNRDYFPNGNLMTDNFYLHDNIHGISKEYSEQGILIKEIGYWNGSMHGLAKYYKENGQLSETRIYYYGKLISSKNEK